MIEEQSTPESDQESEQDRPNQNRAATPSEKKRLEAWLEQEEKTSQKKISQETRKILEGVEEHLSRSYPEQAVGDILRKVTMAVQNREIDRESPALKEAFDIWDELVQRDTEQPVEPEEWERVREAFQAALEEVDTTNPSESKQIKHNE